MDEGWGHSVKAEDEDPISLEKTELNTPSPHPPTPLASPFILDVQGQAWLYKCYLIAESFPMPGFSGEINL